MLAGLLGTLALLKALRLPNRWAATNFVLNYSQGFTRRGLAGEVARTFLGSAALQYWAVVMYAYLALGATIWALMRLCQLALAERRGDPAPNCAILVFLASPALVLIVHLVGYLDYLGLLFTCTFAAAGATSKSRWLPYAVAALAGLVLALIHEAQNVLFMPAVLFVLMCRALQQAQCEPEAEGTEGVRTWGTGLALAAVLSVALVASAYVGLNGDPQRVALLQRWLQERVDFTLHAGVCRALQVSSAENLLTAMWRFWSTPGALWWLLKGFCLSLPAYAFLVACGWQAIGRAEAASSKTVAVLRGCFLLACLSPLTLNLVAWDYARWFAFAVCNALICLLAFSACCRCRPAKRSRAHSQRLALAATMAVALGLASDNILFNDAQVSYYPFFDQWQSLWQLMQAGPVSPAD